MGAIQNTIMSLAIVFSAQALAEAKEQPQPYQGFITTLKSLCAENKNILIGDSNHSDPAILELISNPDVIQAMKECNRPLVLEMPVEENEGYRHIDNLLSEAELTPIIKSVQRSLGFPQQTGKWTEELGWAVSEFIAQKQQEIGWTKDRPGVYSHSFAVQLSKSALHKDLSMALYQLKKGSNLLDPYTLGMYYEDTREFNGERIVLSAEELGGNEHAARLEQLRHDIIYNAAQKSLRLFFADSDMDSSEIDPEVAEIINEAIYESPVLTTQDSINYIIKTDAKANRDVHSRAAFKRAETFLEKRIGISNDEIVSNIKSFSGYEQGILMLYGAGHMLEQNDFDEMLGEKNTVHILLRTSPDQVLMTVDTKDKTAAKMDDTPHFIYDISDDQTYEVTPGSPAEESYQASVSYVITPADYERARAALPADLQSFAFPYTEYDADPANDQVPENWLETQRVYQF